MLQDDSYFAKLNIGYDQQGVTYLRAETNKNVAFSRGFLKKTDSQVTYEFTESVPLVGFQGYETQNQISSLGFISFNCSTDAITSIEQ